MKKDLIEKIDISLDQNSDYREMTILTLQSAKEVLQIYMNLESDYLASQKTLDDEIASFKDRTQEVKDKIDEFYSSSSITLEQVKQAEELCEAIKEQILNYSKHIDEMQDKIEADKQEMQSIKSDTQELEKQTEENAKQSTNALNEIEKNKTELLEKLKDTFDTNLANLEKKIADCDKKIQEAQQEIENSKSEFETLATGAKTEISTLSTDSINAIKNSKEEIDTLIKTSLKQLDELQNQKDDISRLIKNFSNVNIEGTDVTVMTTGNTAHYKFEDGTVLDGVDFINEKADNGVDNIIDKVQNLSILNVRDGITFTNNYDNNKFGSYFTFNEEAKIGFFDSENHQNTITMNLSGTTFSNDIFVGDKKVLKEGDINTANSNQKFFLEEGAERHVPLDGHYEEADKIYLDTNLNPYGLNPYGYPFLNDKKSYYFLSPQLWEKKIGNSVSTIDFVSTNGISIITEENADSGSGTDSSISGIGIQYRKINTNGIGIEDVGTFIYSQEGYPPDYDTSDSPYPLDRSSINISPKQIDIISKSFTYNGREVLFK